MIRFKQFLVERSIENQLAWARQAEQALKNPPVKSSGSSVTYAVPTGPAGGYNIRFDPKEVYPFSSTYPGQYENVKGFYNPPNKNVVMINTAGYPAEALSSGSDTSAILAHEVGHRYQNTATGDKSRMIERTPNYTFKDEVLKKKLGYVHSDIEINARALAAARRAQTEYLKNMSTGIRNATENKFDLTIPDNIQNMKHAIRWQTFNEVIKGEIDAKDYLQSDIKKRLESDTGSIKDNNKNLKRFNDRSNKIQTAMRDKISRAMLEVDPDFSKPGSIQQFLDDTADKDMGEYSRNLLKDKTPTTPVKSPRALAQPSAALKNAANLGAGVVGGLVGEYAVKPAAEKAGVFKAVESGTRAVLSNTPDWVAKAADPVLGAARLALDPIGTTSEFLEKQARMSLPTTKAERDRATERFERKDY
jgi:hypothetical protein